MREIDNIKIGHNLLQNLQILKPYIASKSVVIVTDATIAQLYLQQLKSTMEFYNIEVVILPVGESNKNWHSVEIILQHLLSHGHDRHSTIISLGGGIIGDLTGFAASIYMRGINWIQIPTTLMAQVDSAIGGKTGCNFLEVKNLIGTFYLPKTTIIDLVTLHTLPEREYRAGLAEVIKYGMALDEEFFNWIESNRALIKDRDINVLEHMVSRCCEIKLAIVKDDMYDRGQRQILNFGHTFGHALESATGFTGYLHGEAVALGMLLACRLAVKKQLLAPQILDRLSKLLVYLGLPTSIQADITADVLYSYMAKDKKNQAGTLNLILPCALGQVKIVKHFNAEFLEGILQNYV